ncbi:MAG: hypothetical protein NTV63_05230, partial [Candidatus Woesearchaeota archaeon]|nr:hypothetical protein [Candidatus Woesearchaeota archaeon]
MPVPVAAAAGAVKKGIDDAKEQRRQRIREKVEKIKESIRENADRIKEKINDRKIRTESAQASREPSTRPPIGAYLKGYAQNINADSTLSFLKKIPFVIIGALAALFMGYSGVSWWVCAGIAGLFALIIFSSRTTAANIFNILIVLIVIVLMIYFSMKFFPVLQIQAEISGKKNVQTAGGEIKDFLANTNKQMTGYIETQVECASGNCPTGEAEGEYVGMSISEPTLLVPENEYKAGDDVTFYSDVEGINLRIYNDIIAVPECYIENEKASAISPSEIPFMDISNRKRTVRCVGNTVKRKDMENELNVSVSFPFTTESDLKIYVMDDARRNLMMEMWGEDFLANVYGQDENTVARFNDGPVNLGIRVTQNPIGIRASAKESTSAEIVFALFNQWGYYGGEISKIKNIRIRVPDNIEIYAPDELKDFCPFKKSGDEYVLQSGFTVKYPIISVKSFICGIKVTGMSEQSFDLWMPHIKVIAEYDYIMRAHSDIYLQEAKKTTGDGSSGDGLTEISFTEEDCARLDPSNLASQSYIDIYEGTGRGMEIKEGLDNAISEYQVDWLTPFQMRTMLLGMMTQETSVGKFGDDDGDGTPDHIAGCTSEDNPLYVKNSV